MTDSILQLLQWLVPTGGVGMLLGWITSTRLRHARTAKEVHDTYKTMYDDVHNELTKLAGENSDINLRLARLEQAIARGPGCHLWPHCPIRLQLQRTSQESDIRTLLGQRTRASRDHPTSRHPPRGTSGDDPPDADADDPP